MIQIESIYEKCLNNTATPEEWQQFIEWLKAPENEKKAKELLLAGLHTDTWELPASNHAPDGIIEAILWADKQKMAFPAESNRSSTTAGSPALPIRPVLFLRAPWFRYTAAVLLIAGVAALMYLWNGTRKEIAIVPETEKADMAPGGNRAVLTLADGTSIVLDSAAMGSLARQGTTGIVKPDAGKLVYEADGTAGETMYNTIRTPRGGQYQVVLHDGTKVWLNAMSSIRFPTRFTTSREVSVTGEAFFEISPDKLKPFQVKVGAMMIDVLGTSFNVNAYEDEDVIRTTLLEGKVNIRTSQDLQLLLPGQQSVCRSTSKNILVEKANIEQAIAWKNGFFYFNNADLKTVMRQLARWYNVAVVYEGNLPARVFKGEIGRDLQLSDVLEILNEMGINIKLKQNKLYVTP